MGKKGLRTKDGSRKNYEKEIWTTRRQEPSREARMWEKEGTEGVIIAIAFITDFSGYFKSLCRRTFS